MATQQERLVELFAEFGIEPVAADHPEYADGSVTIVPSVEDGGPVDGYMFFHCRFTFDEDGNFKQMGIWE